MTLIACIQQGESKTQGDFVDVEFYRPVPDSAQKVPDTHQDMPDSADCNRRLPDSVMPRMPAILAFIDQHGHISVPEVASLLAVKERRARAILANLMAHG